MSDANQHELEWMRQFRESTDPTPEEVDAAKTQLRSELTKLFYRITKTLKPFADFRESPPVRTAYAFLQSMGTQGLAIANATETGHVEAAYSNLRSLFEIHVELRYLATGDQNERMCKAYQAILYGLRKQAKLYGARTDQALLAQMRQVEKEFGDFNPDRYAEFNDGWDGPPWHWSLKKRDARNKIIDETNVERLRDEYALLSWKAHGDLVASMHVHETSEGVLFAPVDSPAKTTRIVCTRAAEYFDRSWWIIKDTGWEPMFIAAFFPPLDQVVPKGLPRDKPTEKQV